MHVGCSKGLYKAYIAILFEGLGCDIAKLYPEPSTYKTIHRRYMPYI